MHTAMELTREVRRALERSLPQDVLDFLTASFTKLEDCLYKIKEHQRREEAFLNRIAEKDDMIWQLLQKTQGMRSVGFGRSYEDQDYPSYNRSKEYGDVYSQRRGGDQGSNQGRGNNSQGQTQGGATPQSRVQYVPQIEKPIRRYMPDEAPKITPLYEPTNPEITKLDLETPPN